MATLPRVALTPNTKPIQNYTEHRNGLATPQILNSFREQIGLSFPLHATQVASPGNRPAHFATEATNGAFPNVAEA